MKLLFVGTTQFGLRCLKAVMNIKTINIVGVISGKKTFRVSYSLNKVKNFTYADYSSLCKAHKIPLYLMKDNMKESKLMDFIKSCNPDIALVAGWYHLIPESFFKLIPFFGLHASLLPKYKGGAPLVWAIINGEKKTGITFFLFDKKIDSGSIVGQKEVNIKNSDTINSLYKKIEKQAIKLLQEYLPKIADNKAVFRRQNNIGESIYPQRKPEDGLINWNWNATRIKDFIRAQTKPYPGAFTIINNKKVIFWEADIIELK